MASRTEHGYVAIEGLVRDGGSGEVMAMFADREKAKTRVIDLQSIRWYGHAHEIIDDWAEQLVAVAHQPASPGIKDPAPFTLHALVARGAVGPLRVRSSMITPPAGSDSSRAASSD